MYTVKKFVSSLTHFTLSQTVYSNFRVNLA